MRTVADVVTPPLAWFVPLRPGPPLPSPRFVNVDEKNPLRLTSVQPPYHGIELQVSQPSSVATLVRRGTTISDAFPALAQSGAGPGTEPGSNWLPVVANLYGTDAIMINVTLDGSEVGVWFRGTGSRAKESMRTLTPRPALSPAP